MKLTEFLKYYLSKIIKTWWIIIVFIPAFKKVILELNSFYFQSRYYKYIESILNWLNPWWIWVAVIVFWFVHLKILYKLWEEKVSNQTPISQYDSVPESYMTIVRKIEKLMPEKSGQVRENFAHGYRCLTEPAHRDIKTAISIHFNAYKSIRDFLIEYFSSGGTNVQITIEMSQIRAKFEDNFSQLGGYNNTVGQNNNLPIGEHEVGKLIDDINNNLNALLAHFKL